MFKTKKKKEENCMDKLLRINQLINMYETKKSNPFTLIRDIKEELDTSGN